MSISILNTDAGLSGTTLINAESTQTITGAKTFDRDPSPPFAVSSGSAVVPNLDADKVDGIEGTALLQKAGGTMTGALITTAGTVGAAAIGIGDTDVGLYSSGTNALDLTTAGVKAMGWTALGQMNSPTQFRARATNSAVQTVNAGANAVLTLDGETFDVGGLHSTSVNTERLTIPTGGDGLWLLMGSTVAVTPGASAGATVAMRINGTAYQSAEAVIPTSTNWPIQIVAIANLVATDYVDLHATSATNNVNYGSATAAKATFLQAIKLF